MNSKTCPECDGRGEVLCYYHDLDDRPGTPHLERCGLCGGVMVVTSSQHEEYWLEFWKDKLKEALATYSPEEFDEVKERIFQEICDYCPALKTRLEESLRIEAIAS